MANLGHSWNQLTPKQLGMPGRGFLDWIIGVGGDPP